MQKLIALILQTVLGLQWLEGYRTYLAAAGLVGLALYQLSTGDATAAVQSFLAAIAALGLRGAVSRAELRAADAEYAATQARYAATDAAHYAAKRGAVPPPLTGPVTLPAVLALAGLLLFAGLAGAQQPCPNGRCPLTAAPAPVLVAPTGAFHAQPSGPGEWYVTPTHGLQWITVVGSTPPAAAPSTVDARPFRARLCERVRLGVARQLVKEGATAAEAEAKAVRLTDELIRGVAASKRIDLPTGPESALAAGWLDEHPGVLAIIKLLLQLLPLIL